MTIKNKLIITFGILIVLFSVTGTTLMFGYKYVTGRASIANGFDRQERNLLMMLRGINEVLVTEGSHASIEILKDGIKGFDETYAELLSDIDNDKLKSILTGKVGPAWKVIKKDSKPFQEKYLDVEDEGLMVHAGRLITKTELLMKDIRLLSSEARVVIDSGSEKTMMIKNILVVFLAISMASVMFLLRHLYHSITRPIKELNSIAEGFSRGDLSILMNESGNDEFGMLATYFNMATTKLSGLLSDVKEVIYTLTLKLEELSESFVGITDNAYKQSDKTTQSAAAMEEMNTSFKKETRDTIEAAKSVKEAEELAEKGGEVVSMTTAGMVRISQSVTESAENISALGRRSEDIGEIVKVINDIAEQTNLLALNAAIEAARAGEQGRGFAVVADEVRKLAEKTTSATNEIEKMIVGIQDETNKAVINMESGTKEVEEGVELANQAGESLKNIVTSVQNVTEIVNQIATAAEEQSAIGAEVSSNLESVSGIAKQTASDAREVSDASKELSEQARELQNIVSGFILHGESNGGAMSNNKTHNYADREDSIVSI